MRFKNFSFINQLLALRNRHFISLDVFFLSMTPALAMFLRTDGLNAQPAGWDILSIYFPGLVLYTLLSLVVRLTVFYFFGLYRRYWRYASIEELDQIGWAIFVSTSILMILVLISRIPVIAQTGFPLWNFPRSIVLIDGLLIFVAVGGTRFSVRLATQRQRSTYKHDATHVLVMGAGDAGSMTVREMQKNRHLGMVPIGFVDDDESKYGVHIHGVPVLGTREDIPAIVQDYKVSQMVIAMPTVSGRQIREIVKICEQAGVKPRILPGIYELLDGTVNVNQLRNIDIEDLLRRAPIRTDSAAVHDLLRGKRVMITGAGGSIGSELCRQVFNCTPAELIILGHGENSVFDITNELKTLQRSRGIEDETRVEAVIADIRFYERIKLLLERYRPQIVFHAAAHKHVHLMEMNPAEAITNNVIGTRNIVDASRMVGIEKFVMISTDKAVNPTGVMGASKRVAELIVHNAAEISGSPFVAVRFGNVLGSRGSVVHTFKRQIAAGGPVTVTDPEMCRFFMTIPEAVQLVLQAAVMGSGGQVYVLDMGKPVKIVDLARDLIQLSGLEVGHDVDIEFVGLRPGEKLFEELFIEGEDYMQTQHEKILIASNASTFVPENLHESINALESAAHRDDRDAMLLGLRTLVQGYRGGLEEEIAEAGQEASDTEKVYPVGSGELTAGHSRA